MCTPPSRRRVSEAEKARVSVELGNTCATGRLSRSHDVKGTTNSEPTTAAALGRVALSQDVRAAPSVSGAEMAPHVLRSGLSTAVTLSSTGTANEVTMSEYTVRFSCCSYPSGRSRSPDDTAVIVTIESSSLELVYGASSFSTCSHGGTDELSIAQETLTFSAVPPRRRVSVRDALAGFTKSSTTSCTLRAATPTPSPCRGVLHPTTKGTASTE
eukprot:7389673-Prymnesium_polylepis.3